MSDDKGKTVLILGNGFDLAHGLPTRYVDFLEFCNCINKITPKIINLDFKYYEDILQFIESEKVFFHEALQSFIINRSRNRRSRNREYRFSNIRKKLHKEGIYTKMEGDILSDEQLNSLKDIYQLTKKNIWYLYLYEIYKRNKMSGENWIDFEFEIRIIIECLDKALNNRLDLNFASLISLSIRFTNYRKKLILFKQIALKNIKTVSDMSIFEFNKKLLLDLKNITGALELYLCEFVEKMVIRSYSPDIIKLKADYIINFNYTHTFDNNYSTSTNKNDVFHIHGECKAAMEENVNDMVLGIDEYWSEDECKNHTDFLLFKKFAQRALKGTGVKYLDKINEEYNKNRNISKVYIFGHSLDITDKDILQRFLDNKSTDVTVFCLNEEIKVKLFANVIKLIGESKLNEKVNQDPPKLKFVLQSDMVEINDNYKFNSEAFIRV